MGDETMRTLDKSPSGVKQDIQERAFSFACRIVRLHKHLVTIGGEGRILGNQLLRSGTSIGANLEEAKAGQSKADFISKCSIALKEARETYYLLGILEKGGVVEKARLSQLVDEADQIVSILTAIVKKARQNNKN